jgi:hypothetical protein
VLPPEAGAGVCAPLRNRGRPSCDKLAHPTLPRRIVHDDRNISFLQGLGRGTLACVRGATDLRRMQERLPAAAINQGSVYQTRNGDEDKIHFARGRLSPHRCARAGQCRSRRNQEEVAPAKERFSIGKIVQSCR